MTTVLGEELDWYEAINRNRVDLIEQHLAEGGNPNQRIARPNGTVLPLNIAVGAHRQNIALALLRGGADLELSGETVHVLAQEGLTTALDFVLRQNPARLVVEDDALGAACLSGYYDVVEALLEHARRSNVTWGDHLWQAVSIALSYEHDDIARLLLKRGAPPAARVLHAAALRSSPGMVKYLLQLGADPSLPLDQTIQSEERTPIEFAWKRYSWPEAAEKATARRILFELSQAGARLEGIDLDRINLDGTEEVRRAAAKGGIDAQLATAARLGYYDIAKSILSQRGADPLHDDDLRKATIEALRADNDDIARLLLESGAPPDGGPLHIAARYSSPGMVRYLVSLGADPNEQFQRKTALEHLWEVLDTQPDGTLVLFELLLNGAEACWLEKHKDDMDGLHWAIIEATAAECWTEQID